MPTPTEQAYHELQEAYDCFNAALFGGVLPPCWRGASASPGPTAPARNHRAARKPAPACASNIAARPAASRPGPSPRKRRQLTVMFCNLVDSTALSGQLDPEDLRGVIQAYQSACTEVIQRYDGHVAQLLGDGLLVYFGYPHAHEDDAQRAVRAGWDMIQTIGVLNARLEREQGVRLAVRLGIHTGLVVIGEMGGSGRQEQLALGETPNIAARIQGLAEPNTVVMNSDTQRLVQGYVDCESRGEQNLKGVAQAIPVYRVLQMRDTLHYLDRVGTRGLTPLVGRGTEVSS